MGRCLRGPLVVSLVAAVAAVGVATAYMNPITADGYVDVRESPCWTCHVNWSPPLREMAIITPPEGLTAQVGAEFDYTLRVQLGWLPTRSPEMIRFEPSLDLSGAPSLEFTDSPRPDLGNTTAGLIELVGLPTSSQRAHVVIDVPVGLSDLIIRLRPNNTDPAFGPDLVMNIYPGRDNPQGQQPTYRVDDAGPGGMESIRITAEELQEHGTGAWTVEAEAKPFTLLPEQHLPSPNILGGIGFTVATDRYFNVTGGVQFLSRDHPVGSGLTGDQVAVFSWHLRARAPPEPGESILVALNLTSYYRHVDTRTEDLAYTHHAYRAPVVAAPDGGISFETEDTTVIVIGPDVTTGVSLVRISEVIGYVAVFLLLASNYTGGVFGKASRRQLNRLFESARRRVAFHNFVSYAIIATAVAHTIIFVVPGLQGNYHWTHGLIWGGAAILALFGLGVTGALQVPMIRKWNYAVWRWSHLGLSIAVIVLTLVHILLEGGNFENVKESVGWQNWLDPRL